MLSSVHCCIGRERHICHSAKIFNDLLREWRHGNNREPIDGVVPARRMADATDVRIAACAVDGFASERWKRAAVTLRLFEIQACGCTRAKNDCQRPEEKAVRTRLEPPHRQYAETISAYGRGLPCAGINSA